MLKAWSLITDEEFEKLSDVDQMRYLYCLKCGYYYLVERKNKHLCNEN
jgi:predicted nucleic-acid-binding Zn-ribbon protein